MAILKKLPQKDIKPVGWLKKQLVLQAQGLTGNIEKHFSDLSADNAWLGGKGEAWERGPYYLDGLVPLAFLLNDKELIKKVYTWMDAILGSKNVSTGFGPLRSVDYWPRMVAQKALISFYRATGDGRVIPFLLIITVLYSKISTSIRHISGRAPERLRAWRQCSRSMMRRQTPSYPN